MRRTSSRQHIRDKLGEFSIICFSLFSVYVNGICKNDTGRLRNLHKEKFDSF